MLWGSWLGQLAVAVTRLPVATQTWQSRTGAVMGRLDEFSRLWEVKVAFAVPITQQQCAKAERPSNTPELDQRVGMTPNRSKSQQTG